MIQALLVFVDIFVCAVQNVFRKPFTVRYGGKGTYIFNAFSTAAAMVFFTLSAGSLSWEPGVLPYTIGFAVSYAVSTAATMLAISCGPLALTALIMSSSTILPTLYGLLFLKEEVRYATFLPGLLLLLVSFFLTNKPQKGEKVSVRWLVFTVLAACGNGGCTIFQTAQQVAFDRQYGNELMLLSLAMVTVIFLVIALCTERKELRTHIKSGWLPGSLCGVCNGINNLLVMLLRPMLGAAILFPLLSGGGLVATYLIALLLYKEKLSKTQTAGFILGIGAVVLLSI